MAPLLAQRPRVDRSFERLYRRHVSDVYHYALAVLRNPADAEDVTQTAFLNAYSAYRRGERPTAPRNWLIAIAHNVCRQRFRQSARRPHEVSFDEDVADTLVDDETPSAEDIRAALGHLAFNQRAALVMRELEGRSYAEIAELLDLSVSAVETLIFRARRALREQLEGSLTCQQAELAISRQMDGRLSRSERGALRAHLRACPECASFARSQRAQRAAVRSIASIPLPASLASFFGGGAATGTGLAVKATAFAAAAAVVTGVGYEGVTRLPTAGDTHAAADVRTAAPKSSSGGAAVVSTAPRSSAARAGAAATGSVAKPVRPVAHRRETARGRSAIATARRKEHSAKPKAHRGGRPAAPPGRSKGRTTASRGHATSRPHRTAKPKPPSGRSKPKPAGGRGRPEQSGNPRPRGQDKKPPPLPVSPPAVATPTVPPPALPDPPKVKK